MNQIEKILPLLFVGVVLMATVLVKNSFTSNSSNVDMSSSKLVNEQYFENSDNVLREATSAIDAKQKVVKIDNKVALKLKN